jgi:DNA-binding NarL/FixJ family response regulator
VSIRVLLVDDDPLLRAGLRLRPDVILMDIRMPGTATIAARPHPPRILVLTTFDAMTWCAGLLQLEPMAISSKTHPQAISYGPCDR